MGIIAISAPHLVFRNAFGAFESRFKALKTRVIVFDGLRTILNVGYTQVTEISEWGTDPGMRQVRRHGLKPPQLKLRRTSCPSAQNLCSYLALPVLWPLARHRQSRKLPRFLSLMKIRCLPSTNKFAAGRLFAPQPFEFHSGGVRPC